MFRSGTSPNGAIRAHAGSSLDVTDPGPLSGIPSCHEAPTSFWIASDRCMTSANRCMRGRSRTSGVLGCESAPNFDPTPHPDQPNVIAKQIHLGGGSLGARMVTPPQTGDLQVVTACWMQNRDGSKFGAYLHCPGAIATSRTTAVPSRRSSSRVVPMARSSWCKSSG